MTSTVPPDGDLPATGAYAAGRGRGSLDAVQAARQDARDGGFAGAALARKDVAVGDALLRDGVLQGGLDVLLVDHVLERLGAVFSCNDLVHAVGECQAPGNPRHTNRTATVASFRTWRGLRPPIARSPRPDKYLS